MTDFIIREPYVIYDERLFPPGWRSFSNLVYGVNRIEYAREISSVNGISGPLYNELLAINEIEFQCINNEYIGMNDLTGAIISVIAKFQLEISREYECLNNIETPQTNEIISFNDLVNIMQDIIAKFNLEISNELVSLNRIEAPQTREILSVNDLIYPIEEINSINILEISSELVSLNKIETPQTREYIGINYLSLEIMREITGIIDIFEYPIATREISGINRLDVTATFASYEHAINIYIDDQLVNDYVESWEINIDKESYVNSCTVVFTDKTMFSNCNPSDKIGDRRINAIIDNISYKFMIEKRNPHRTTTDTSFSIWGRSYIANLDLPYAIPISDKEITQDEYGDWYSPDDDSYIPHIWQTQDVTAKTIMESVIGDFVLDFKINDFIVKKGLLNVSYQTPISIVNTLAKVVGATVRTDLNDKVIIRYSEFNIDGEPIATFLDTEDIFMLNEDLSYPSGYNKVLVKGYEDPLIESASSFNLELDNVLNEDKTKFYFGDEIYIRLYKTPLAPPYTVTCSLGDLYLVGSDTPQIISRESTGFSGKTLTTDYPILSITSIERYNCENLISSQYSFTVGYNVVNSETTIEDEPVLISYNSKYDLYKLVVNQPCNPMTFTEVLSEVVVKQI